MKNKTKLYINLAIFVLAIAGVIVSLVFFIKSCNIEVYYQCDENWNEILDANGNKIPDAYNFESDYDYLILMLGSILVAVMAGFNSFTLYKKDTFNSLANISTVTICGALMLCYPLGVFFKALSKAVSKGKIFEYGIYQWYLYFGILGAIILALGIVKLYQIKKQVK